MNLKKREAGKQLVLDWLSKMEKNQFFGFENSKKIRNWLIIHERVFGTEFEERYDPY